MASTIKVPSKYPKLWKEYLDTLDDDSRALYKAVPKSLFDIYRLDSFLAKGGQGVAFLVRDGMGRKALMKIGKYKSLRHEYEALSNIVSPNIISLFFGERFGDAMVLVEEYVHGVNLGQVMKKARTNRWVGHSTYNVFVTMILIQVIEAIHSIHHSQGDCGADGKLEDRSFVHRDIKPDNIMLAHNGRIKLIDFGLARKHGATDAMTTSFSLPFSSPNQIHSKAPHTDDDYFSLACMAVALYEGGIERFYDEKTIRAILNGKGDSFIDDQFSYFYPRIEKILETLDEVQTVMQGKFAPNAFKPYLKEVKQHPERFGNKAQERIDVINDYIKGAQSYPFARELYKILRDPFRNAHVDTHQFVFSCNMHRYVHHEFMGRQTLLISAGEK